MKQNPDQIRLTSGKDLLVSSNERFLRQPNQGNTKPLRQPDQAGLAIFAATRSRACFWQWDTQIQLLMICPI